MIGNIIKPTDQPTNHSTCHDHEQGPLKKRCKTNTNMEAAEIEVKYNVETPNDIR